MSADRALRRRRPDLRNLVAVPDRARGPVAAVDVVGTDLAGVPSTLRIDGAPHTLLLFLTSGCDGCQPFWPALVDPASLGLSAGDRVAAIGRDADRDDTAALAQLAPPGATVVCAGNAWTAYRVAGPPFFALVDGANGRVVTEGVAWAVPQVAADVRRAVARTDPGVG